MKCCVPHKTFPLRILAQHVARAFPVVSFIDEHYFTFHSSHFHSCPTIYKTTNQTSIDVIFARRLYLRRSIECVFRSCAGIDLAYTWRRTRHRDSQEPLPLRDEETSVTRCGWSLAGGPLSTRTRCPWWSSRQKLKSRRVVPSITARFSLHDASPRQVVESNALVSSPSKLIAGCKSMVCLRRAGWLREDVDALDSQRRSSQRSNSENHFPIREGWSGWHRRACPVFAHCIATLRDSIAAECQSARAVVAKLFGGLESRKAQAEGVRHEYEYCDVCVNRSDDTMLDDNFSGFATTHQWSHDHSTTVRQGGRQLCQSSWSTLSETCPLLATTIQNEIPPLRGGRKTDTQIRRNCATLNLTTILDWWVSTLAQGHANLLFFVPNTDRDTQSKKDTKYTGDAQGQSDAHAGSPDSNAVDHNSRDTKDTRVSAGSRRINTVPRKTGVLVKNCPPCETFVAPRPDVRTRFRPKTQKNRINAKFSRQSSGTQQETCWSRLSKSRFAARRCAFMSCMPHNISSFFWPFRKRHVDVNRFFIRMISRTSSESDSFCNRVSNATEFVNGLMSFASSSLNKDAPLAFRRLLDSNVGSKVHLHRFLTRNDSITAQARNPGLVWLSANIVKVLTQWIRALETGHCSLMPRAASFVRELRSRSCGDSLLVKASKIPRESVRSIPPTCLAASSKCQRRIGAPCNSDQASRANQRDSPANARAWVSPLFGPAIFLGSLKDRQAITLTSSSWPWPNSFSVARGITKPPVREPSGRGRSLALAREANTNWCHGVFLKEWKWRDCAALRRMSRTNMLASRRSCTTHRVSRSTQQQTHIGSKLRRHLLSLQNAVPSTPRNMLSFWAVRDSCRCLQWWICWCSLQDQLLLKSHAVVALGFQQLQIQKFSKIPSDTKTLS